MKKKTFIHLNNEKGSIIVIVLLILCIITVIGVSSIDTTVVEQQVTINDQLHKVAFYATDGGIFATTKLVSRVLSETGPVTSGVPGVTYLKTDSDPGSSVGSTLFYEEIMGYSDLLGRAAWDTEADMEFTIGNGALAVTVQSDVRRLKTISMIGGGVEFAAGAEGAGSGSAGSAAIYYVESVQGTGARNSAASCDAEYRKVIGIPTAGEL